jgi:hypothetical protein
MLTAIAQSVATSRLKTIARSPIQIRIRRSTSGQAVRLRNAMASPSQTSAVDPRRWSALAKSVIARITIRQSRAHSVEQYPQQISRSRYQRALGKWARALPSHKGAFGDFGTGLILLLSPRRYTLDVASNTHNAVVSSPAFRFHLVHHLSASAAPMSGGSADERSVIRAAMVGKIQARILRRPSRGFGACGLDISNASSKPEPEA